MNNFANQAYKNASNHARYSDEPAKIVLAILQEASQIMVEVACACEQSQIERRAKLIEKVIHGISAIETGFLADDNQEQLNALSFLKFTRVIKNAIVQINVSNDPKKALLISEQLKKLSLSLTKK